MLRFGKYNGRDVTDVIKTDPDYIKWVSKQPHIVLSDAIREIIKKALPASVGYKLTFGRHRGKTLKYISENDSKYIIWLKRNQYVNESMHELVAELEKY